MDRKIITSARIGTRKPAVRFGGDRCRLRLRRQGSRPRSPGAFRRPSPLRGPTWMVIRDSDAADDSAAFYGDTSIINGALDCNAWILDNHGALGDGMIDANDECTLIGYDGTPDGITISVVAGEFTEAGGSPIAEGYVLPKVFNAAEPDNPRHPRLRTRLVHDRWAGRLEPQRDDRSRRLHAQCHRQHPRLGIRPRMWVRLDHPRLSDGLVDLNSDETHHRCRHMHR